VMFLNSTKTSLKKLMILDMRYYSKLLFHRRIIDKKKIEVVSNTLDLLTWSIHSAYDVDHPL